MSLTCHTQTDFQLTISCRVSSRPTWLSAIACWCFFPRKWLSKYTSDGIWKTYSTWSNMPLQQSPSLYWWSDICIIYKYYMTSSKLTQWNVTLTKMHRWSLSVTEQTLCHNTTMTLQTMHNFFFSYGTSFGASLWSSVECRRMLMRNAFSCIASRFSLCLRSVSSCYAHKHTHVHITQRNAVWRIQQWHLLQYNMAKHSRISAGIYQPLARNL